MSRIGLLGLSMALVVSVFCSGCGPTFSHRFDTVYIGMTEMEVQAALGEPDVRFSDSWSYIRSRPMEKAVIRFENGRVSDKAWYDATHMDDFPGARTAPAGTTPTTTTIVR